MGWGNDLLNFIFPRRCHICGNSLAPHERYACSMCLSKLPRTGYHRRTMNPMEQRFAGLFPFEKASGHFFYTRDSSLSILIQDMKYRNFPQIGILLGKVMATDLYSTGFFNDIELILPIPMHFWKQAKRGYNQAEKIAEGISEIIGVPVSDALRMIRSHSTQTALIREERLANTENLFSVKKIEELEGRHILLVDDVCTTGATICSAASAIMSQCPSVKLTILTLGVTF